MKTLGFIGLGAMGTPIAQHLMAGGFTLYTAVRSQRSKDKAQAMGITVVPSYGHLAKVTNRVVLLVSDYAQCLTCLQGEQGLLSSMKEGILILSSTIAPHEAEALTALLPAGVRLVDAPVSGGVPGAQAGILVTMAAGAEADVEAVQDIFQCYSKKVVYAGNRPGMAQSMKAINQMLVSIHMVATAEAMALSQRLGIDGNVMLDTISECAGNSNIFRNRMPKLIAGDFTSRAALETLEKDTKICMDLADTHNVPCYLTALCHDLFTRTPRSETAAEDACAVIRMYNQ